MAVIIKSFENLGHAQRIVDTVKGCESEWTPGDGDGQGGLACCDS